MRSIFNKFSKAFRIFSSAARLFLFRLRLGRLALPGYVYLSSSVRLSATDGGTLRIDPNTVVDAGALIVAKRGSLKIGVSGFIGKGSIIVARDAIYIGHNSMIAEYVTIRDQDHKIEVSGPFGLNGFVTAPIRIGNNVWIGAKATVLKGVTIGDNVVIGANSVVTHDIPSNSVAVGAPARVIRTVRASS
jgi:acetyltransferase-like isoleucine patch superfamily enzyme